MKKRLTILGSAVVIVALIVFIAYLFVDVLLPKSEDEGWVADDVAGLAIMGGQYELYLVDCPGRPTTSRIESWEDMQANCGNLRRISVDERTWQDYSRGQHYP